MIGIEVRAPLLGLSTGLGLGHVVDTASDNSNKTKCFGKQ